MVDDDDGDGFPSLDPRTDSKSAPSRGFRAWRRLHILKCDETSSLIFSLHETEYMELELRSVEHQGAHETGEARLGGRARPHPHGQVEAPLTWIFLPVYFIYSKKILR